MDNSYFNLKQKSPRIFHAISRSWRWKLICLPAIFGIKTPQVYLHWFWWDESKKLNYLYDQPSHFYLWYFEMKMGLVPDVFILFRSFSSFFAAIIIGFMYTLVVLIKVHYLISINQLDNNIWWIITEALTFFNFSIGHFVIGRWCQSLWCSF